MIGSLNNTESALVLTRDLLVEAPIFAGEPMDALESIWDDLARLGRTPNSDSSRSHVRSVAKLISLIKHLRPHSEC